MAIDEKILKYFELTRSRGELGEVLAPWLVVIGREFPDKIEDIKRRVAEADLTEAMIPIYEEHFSEEEMDALIAFNESPVGRKVRATHKQMTAQEAAVIQKFVMGIMGL